MAELTGADILNMDDETFLKTNPIPAPAASESEPDKTATQTETETSEQSETQTEEQTATEGENPEGKTAEGAETKEVEDEATEAAAEDDKSKAEGDDKARDEQGRFKSKDGKEVTDPKGEKKPEGEVQAKDPNQEKNKPSTEETQSQVQDYKGFVEKVMKPFKANGRTIELKTPEEVIQLMQMGANYTKKMQDLVPHRKVLTMLQNNGLMDEAKLSYLIDLDKKNPEAIKKLVKDAGIDPTEIDNSVESAYKQGNHTVSDTEVVFNTTLEDMKSTPEGIETIKVINGGWDQASKEALWQNPNIMTLIHQQRESGMYDRIANEVARRQVIGEIQPNIPFLQAYNVVGEQLSKAGAFNDLTSPVAPPPKAVVAPVATRVQAPKPKVANGERAAAVSPNRNAPTPKAGNVDYLAMSDDDFLKKFEGRV